MKAIAGITSILLLAIMFVTNSSSVTAATNYNVTPISSCTLPDAIIAANTNAIQGSCPAGTVGLDTITMAAGTYALTANLPIITEDLHIIGASVDTTLIDGDDTYSGLIVKDSNDVDIRNLITTIDLLSLCTYMPDEIEPLYHIIDEHMSNILGGKN